jgi:hypothetical protein
LISIIYSVWLLIMSETPTNNDGATATSGRKPYVRVITEKRREQNRRSQKAYRDRLKKRLEGLEELEEQVKAKTPAVHSSEADYSLYESPGGLHHEPREGEYSLGGPQDGFHLRHNPSDSSVIDLGDAFEVGGDLPVPAESTLPLLNIAIRPRTPSQTTPGSGPSQWTVARQTWPSFPQNQRLSSSPHDESCESRASSTTATTTPLSSWPGFSLSANFLRLQSENSLAACLAIAATLVITQDSYINDHPSPFYLSSRAFDSGFLASGTEFGYTPPSYLESPALTEYPTPSLHSHHSIAKIKPDLRPSNTQLVTPHPSYLDCIIYPSFRDRAIELSAAEKLDHWDLFCDIVNDGLVCWGSANKAGMENGVAWSMRSWEARPWFLKKWWFLAGGEDEEVWQGSRWWWSMRGEDVAVDDLLFTQCEEL